MKRKRLTFRDKYNCVQVYSEFTETEVLNSFAELEDKIESGRLVESIKEVRVPPYDKFSIWDRYGISKECYICRNNITNNPYFIAHCFNRHNRFENSEQGLQDAVVWLEEQRADVLRLLGYKELQNG